MVTAVTVVFGPPAPSMAAEDLPQEEYTDDNYGLDLPGPPQEMPSFDEPQPISHDKGFLFGGPSRTCSVPCATWDVILTPATGNTPLCGFQVHDCNIIAVGNGNVMATPVTHDVPSCGTIKVQINGMDPPVFVTDGSTITVSLVYQDPWNVWCCACIEVCPHAMLGMMGIMKSLLRYKTGKGKVKLDPKTNRPIIVIDKKELMRRIIERRQRLRRKKK